MIRRYSELRSIRDFRERYEYLALQGVVGDSTFGFDRYLNQMFYRSAEWKRIRSQVIARDHGCDLGVRGFEIHTGLYIHHMNPMTKDQIIHSDPAIKDPNFLITVSHRTHNAIHYGDESQLPREYRPRQRNDTKLW